MHTPLVRRHPALLLRRSQPDPHKIRLRLIDARHGKRIFLRCQFAERRHVCARNYQPRILLLQARNHFLLHFLRAAVEIMPPAVCRRLPKGLHHQVGPGCPLNLRIPAPPRLLRQRIAIRNRHQTAVLHGTVVRILVTDDGCMYIRYADVISLQLMNILRQIFQQPIHVDDCNVDP